MDADSGSDVIPLIESGQSEKIQIVANVQCHEDDTPEEKEITEQYSGTVTHINKAKLDALLSSSDKTKSDPTPSPMPPITPNVVEVPPLPPPPPPKAKIEPFVKVDQTKADLIKADQIKTVEPKTETIKSKTEKQRRKKLAMGN